MRPAPRICPDRIVAAARLDPNGAHELEIAVPSGIVGMRFSRDQVDQLEAIIARWRERVAFADGGPDMLRPRFEPLEGWR